MSVSGGYFALEDFFSPARFNRKTNTHLTGSQIASLNPTYPNQLVVCTLTEAGFTADTAYLRNTANTAWIGLTAGRHKHDADNETSGGLFSDILHANVNKAFWINCINPAAGEFQKETANGGSIADEPTAGRIGITTGTTNGGYGHLGKSGVKMNFARNSKFMFKGYATVNTFLSVRLGVAMENVNSGLDVLRKYGLEACDSAGVARNYDVISADGTTRSAVASTEDVSQSSAKAYVLEHVTAQDVKFYSNNVLMVTKTTNVPASSRTGGIYNAGAGIKTNNVSTKNLYLYGIALAGAVSDEVWA